jgi:hypothetical protein
MSTVFNITEALKLIIVELVPADELAICPLSVHVILGCQTDVLEARTEAMCANNRINSLYR